MSGNNSSHFCEEEGSDMTEMYGGGWKGLMFVLISAHALFCLATATTCTSPTTVSTYTTTPVPIVYNNSPTTGPGCILSVTLLCPDGVLLLDNDTGSAELDTSKVFAWDREVDIVFSFAFSKVRQVNLFFYNIPSSGIGLPPAELFWSIADPINPDIPLSDVIVGNQDLSQDDRTLRNVSLVVTTDQSSIADYRFFRIHFTFPAETSMIDWILLSEVQLCGEAVSLPTTNITFMQPPSMEPPVPPGPDNVVSAANLSCTVANEGSFQWQWTSPPGITLSQMWAIDGTRTSIVQISQISAANAGEYTCHASFNGQSASTSIAVQLNQMLVSSPTTTVATGDPSATLSCEVYGYLMRQPPTITWNFGSDVLMNDSVFTITEQDSSHMIQNGGDTPQPSMRSVLTISHPNRTHEGSYSCSGSGSLSNVTLEVIGGGTFSMDQGRSTSSTTPPTSSTPLPSITTTSSTNIGGIIGGVVGALGALLTVAFLVATVAVVIAVCVQLSRKKEEVPTVAYEVVGPPQLAPRNDPITTDVNVAYASNIQTCPNVAYASNIQTHPNAAYASTS